MGIAMSVNIFISAVSDDFRAYRDQLRSDLTRHNVEVKIQQNFKDYGVVHFFEYEAASASVTVHPASAYGRCRLKKIWADSLRKIDS
jgi:hypothetical protein